MLEVLYRDEYLIAVEKPAGMLVHRSDIDRRETIFLVQTLRDQIGQKVFPVHRLDKPTSGVILFALSSEIARTLNLAFTQGEVSKRYLAVVRGTIDPRGEIDYPLKEKLDRIADRDADKNKPAQSAITAYRRISLGTLEVPTGRYPTSRYSLVECFPRTGRKHQLRRHMKHISHQIIGDTTHGDGKHNQTFRKHLNCHRLLLAATQLTLQHPVTQDELVIDGSLDETFKAVLIRFDWIV
ncbi:MAG: tRNA pseudouridine(65) synthase TruC [Gammaproteobacteria bacterium]|nr:tRNA pseudouridine(65) synthase TruC [Gammaproteobacteria bacterium]